MDASAWAWLLLCASIISQRELLACFLFCWSSSIQSHDSCLQRPKFADLNYSTLQN
ncbi:unnamed protein product [Linum tenue]|uniref:Uncharacterized protein n=1 Tax=Linum tenue TaxID=586396 RepID=A0AAV0KWU3_9ROSI|nr:unnamed protein product [Linum tenue]CAI0446070.1 unnamed protein product [Linum tenue]CAI0627195.1 unnamed protein product [Linum tenue]